MKYVLLLRGINVGGNNKLAMKDLKALLEGGGASQITTVIQSGNVVLESVLAADQLARQTQKAISDKWDFTPQIMTLPADEYLAAINANPFPLATAEPKTLHAFFAHQDIHLDRQALTRYQAESESINVAAKVLWLHAPDGVDRSKLMSNIARVTQCETTARNWNTLNKLKELLS